jgi:hypothetical protein
MAVLSVVILALVLLGMMLVKFVPAGAASDPPPSPPEPTNHAKGIDLEKMCNGTYSDPWAQERSEQWHRDMEANRRVYGWAERERGFERYIEDIKAGRRK